MRVFFYENRTGSTWSFLRPGFALFRNASLSTLLQSRPCRWLSSNPGPYYFDLIRSIRRQERNIRIGVFAHKPTSLGPLRPFSLALGGALGGAFAQLRREATGSGAIGQGKKKKNVPSDLLLRIGNCSYFAPRPFFYNLVKLPKTFTCHAGPPDVTANHRYLSN